MTDIKIGDWANHFTARFQKPEIAAGHRIDEPANYPEFPDNSGQDGEKEAVSANGDGFPMPLFRKWLHDEIGISDCYKTYADEFLRRDAQDMYLGAKWAWQHQQAVVDQKEAEAKEWAAKYWDEAARVGQLAQESSGLISEIKELQKRVGDALTEIERGILHVGKSNHVARVALKEIKKALGADHDPS